MKQGMDLAGLATELERQRAARRDFIAPTSLLRMTLDGAAPSGEGADLGLDLNGSRFGVQQTAHRQIAERLGIPTKYYDRMMSDAPALLAGNVNHWLATSDDKRMVRTLDGEVRAFLSDRYRPLDNAELAEAVLPVLQQTGATVESCNISPTKFHLKATLPAIKEEIPPAGVAEWQWGKDHHPIDIISPGIAISNSEVGAGSLSIQPATWTTRCSNLAVFKSDAMRKTHLGRANGQGEDFSEYYTDATKEAQDRALWLQVRDLARAALEGVVFRRIVDELKKARGMVIEKKPAELIEIMARRFGLSEAEGNGILDHLSRGGEMTRYGLSNAVTAYSQDDALAYDRASELERLGGELIELDTREWQTIAVAA